MTTLLGLDVGTTGCKAVLFDEDGTLLASASREYAVDLPQPGWAEQDIERVWELAMEAMGQAIAMAGAGEVAAIGLSVHGEAVTPVDGAWRPLRPTILGMDTRTGPQNDWLRERFGGERLFERTGMPIHTVNTLPKLLWIREHEPDTWSRAERFVLVEDFFIGRMTGQAVVSECLASRTQLLDLAAGRWDDEILGAIGLEAGPPEHGAALGHVGRPALGRADGRPGAGAAPGDRHAAATTRPAAPSASASSAPAWPRSPPARPRWWRWRSPRRS